jgi:hypothetical protein
MTGMERSEKPWNGKAAAVSLTYDGTLLEHAERVAPFLAHCGIRGTFYLAPSNILSDPPIWREVAKQHEIASHTLYEAADALGRLPNWTHDMVLEDFRMVPALLEEATGASRPFGFAYPGLEPFGREGPYTRIVRRCFSHARTMEAGLNGWSTDPYGIRSVRAGGLGADEMMGLVEEASGSGAWLVMCFDGVGAGENAVDDSEHEAFVCGLVERRELLLASVSDVCRLLPKPVQPQTHG